jgi:hypothetical protein
MYLFYLSMVNILHTIVLTVTQQVGYLGIWLGGTDQMVEGSWLWSGNPKANFDLYTNWGDGEPSSLTVSEDCLEYPMQWGGKWNDVDCDGEHPFICEM